MIGNDGTISNTEITNNLGYPNAKKHKIISFIKSGIRILGYTLIPHYLTLAVTILVISEFIGIFEETV